MLLLFAPAPGPTLSLRPPAREAHPPRKKPRAPRLSRNGSATHRWHAVDPSDGPLNAVAAALAQWNARTGQRGFLPSDSHLRRCEVARELRLQSLVVRAGGHRAVQQRLGLRPQESAARLLQERELAALSEALADVLAEAGLPPLGEVFPEKRVIRSLSPQLGNRIAAFPGRNGYNRLEQYVRFRAMRLPIPEASQETLSPSRKWRAWTDPEIIRAELLAYQLHPQVLPRLNSLPRDLSAAIQRQGGAAAFASAQGMILDKDWINVTRLARLVRWLADFALDNSGVTSKSSLEVDEYVNLIRRQAADPPQFPSQEAISCAGLTNELQRYGGRKSLALRLGFAHVHGIRDAFMGPFSVQYAADILEFASRQVYVHDGSVAMPTAELMRANGRNGLAEAVVFFNGEDNVGRRVGLVPLREDGSGDSVREVTDRTREW